MTTRGRSILRRHTTVADRPALNVEYTTSTDPMIVVSRTPLAAFSSQPGVPSAEQWYAVAGRNLTGDVVVDAPADFEISTTSGSGFGSTVTLTRAAARLSRPRSMCGWFVRPWAHRVATSPTPVRERQRKTSP